MKFRSWVKWRKRQKEGRDSVGLAGPARQCDAHGNTRGLGPRENSAVPGPPRGALALGGQTAPGPPVSEPYSAVKRANNCVINTIINRQIYVLTDTDPALLLSAAPTKQGMRSLARRRRIRPWRQRPSTKTGCTQGDGAGDDDYDAGKSPVRRRGKKRRRRRRTGGMRRRWWGGRGENMERARARVGRYELTGGKNEAGDGRDEENGGEGVVGRRRRRRPKFGRP